MEVTTIASGVTEVGLFTLPEAPGNADILTDDDDYDRRPQRRKYEEPVHLKVRKQLLGIAESVRYSLPAMATTEN